MTRRFFEWGAWCSSPGTRYGDGERPEGGWLQSHPFAAVELGLEQVAANGPDEQRPWFRHGAVGVVRPSR